MKECRCCHEVKSDSEFYRVSANTDGLHSYCKTCYREKWKRWGVPDITVEEACRRVLSRCVPIGDCLIYGGVDYLAKYAIVSVPSEISSTGREYAHRLIYINAHGDIPSDKLVHHTCEHKLCCNEEHLELRENVEHSSHHNLGVPKEHPCRGENHGRAKLLNSDIPKILALRGIMTPLEIASEFGVSRGIIYNILAGVTWKSVSEVEG